MQKNADGYKTLYFVQYKISNTCFTREFFPACFLLLEVFTFVAREKKSRICRRRYHIERFVIGNGCLYAGCMAAVFSYMPYPLYSPSPDQCRVNSYKITRKALKRQSAGLGSNKYCIDVGILFCTGIVCLEWNQFVVAAV